MDRAAPDTWQQTQSALPADAAASSLYQPLLEPHTPPDGCFVLGRLAQSLDGRIATSSGDSRWIGGPQDILHTHRLRALFDAVVVGAGTVLADDPQLTTRAVDGPSPVRVVLDTERRLDARQRIFCGGPPTLLLCAADAPGEDHVGIAPVVRVKRAQQGLDAGAVLGTLAARGLRRVLIEGGGVTVSRFLAAGALDRLHVTIAPLLIGSGIPAFTLPHAVALSDCLRFDWAVHRLGADLLVDVPLTLYVSRGTGVTEARAFWTTAPGVGELRTETLGEPAPGQVLLRMLSSGVSRGTEALVLAGRVPPSQYETMRAPLMAGAFPFPVKYGYSAVAQMPDGRRVFVLHPHQDVFIAPQAMCVPVPNAVPTRRAVLAANMETALNALWDAAPLAGERMAVIGGGVVGLLIASLLARMPAARVTLIDSNPARAALASGFGCDFAMPAAAPREQELVVHASGSEAGLRLALACAGFEARIVEASWFGDACPSLPLGEAFHTRRLRLIATQVGAVAPAMRGRRSHAERLAMALDLLADPRYDALLEGPTRFADLPEAMPRILATGGLCHVIEYAA